MDGFLTTLRSFLGGFRFLWKQANHRARLKERGLLLQPFACISVDKGAFLHVEGPANIGNFSVITIANEGCSDPARSALRLGKNVYIGEHVNIRASGGLITIGDDCLIASGTTMVASNHGMAPEILIRQQPWDRTITGVTIGSDVWIGAGVILLPGCRVGNGAIIAAGAVVRGEVPAHTVFGGVPARQISSRRERPVSRPPTHAS